MSEPKLNIKEETSAKKTRSPPKRAKVEQSVPRKKKLKFSFKEQREFDTIDEEIEVLEQKIADLDSEMMKSATNSVKLGELMVKKDETEKALEEKMDRWVYLNDLNERILNGE